MFTLAISRRPAGGYTIMTRLVILGASGFIGRHCIRTLASHDLEVFGVSRSVPHWASDGIRDRWQLCNVLDIKAVSRLLSEVKPTHLLHLAWYSGHGGIWTTVDNLDWSAASLKIAREFARHGGQRLVMTGSCAEYGGSGCFSEEQAANPGSLYGVAKQATRQTIELMSRQEGVSFAWPRLFHMYGPHEDPRRLVAAAIQALLQGQPFLSSDGEQLRDFLYIEDVANVVTALLFSDLTGAINIGSGAPLTLRRLLETVADHVGRRDLLKFGMRPRTAHDPDVMIPLLERQSCELRWTPHFSLEAGMMHCVEWWKVRLARNDLDARFA